MGLSMNVVIAIFVSLFAATTLPTSNAWGTEGHYMVCKIAQSYLTSTASSAVLNLLPAGANGDLASECSWADTVRGAYPWSSALHYIDTPDNLCTYDYTNNLTQALMFLSHFMGDVHQPLHVGFTTDAGGNSITVYWYNVKTNLHSVWDTKIIQTSMSNYFGNSMDTMANSITANITSTQISQWNSCGSSTSACADTVATESIQNACNYAYKDAPNNAYLSDTYYLSRSPVVNTRIAQGAVRLANFLNQIFV
ncbi:hypothetical protein LUZ63_011020 [Rhynchospora breviuscula]|uniref:Aspergillus nuclease S1 n=1 Tax=Rhynchospora breviuscula TaxID=2022672 RepID=A0A9Q0CHY9_9POAL|nr:hypothetical protein LUZ63_011020 [Rhynchospora breviuscula]